MLFLSRFQLLNHILELLFLCNCIQVFLLLACFLTFGGLGGAFLGRSLFDFEILGSDLLFLLLIHFELMTFLSCNRLVLHIDSVRLFDDGLQLVKGVPLRLSRLVFGVRHERGLSSHSWLRNACSRG